MWVIRSTRPSAPHCPGGTDQDVSGSPCRPSVRSLTISARFPWPTTRTWRNSAGRCSVNRTATAAAAASGAVTTSSTAAASTSKARFTARPSGAWAAHGERRNGSSGTPHTSSRRPPGRAAPSPGSGLARHTSAASAWSASTRAPRRTASSSTPESAGAHTITRLMLCPAAGAPSPMRLSSTSTGISPSSGRASSRLASSQAAGPSPVSRAPSVSRPRRRAARSAADTATRAATSRPMVRTASRSACPAVTHGSTASTGTAAAMAIRPAWSATRRQIRSRCSPLTDSDTNTSTAYAPAAAGNPVLRVTQARAAPRATTSASGMATAAAIAPVLVRYLDRALTVCGEAGLPGETRPGPGGAFACPRTTLMCRPPPPPPCGGWPSRTAAGPRSGPHGPRRTRTA